MNTPNGPAILSALAKLAAGFQRKLDTDMVAVYQEALGQCDPELLTMAVRRAVAEEARFPVPSVLLGYYALVRNDYNHTNEERRYLLDVRSHDPKRQDSVNRRGRALLRAVAGLTNGPDVLRGLPGDDGPLSEQEASEVAEEARAIAAGEYDARRRFYEEMDTYRASGTVLKEVQINAIRKKYGVEPPKVYTYYLTEKGIMPESDTSSFDSRNGKIDPSEWMA